MPSRRELANAIRALSMDAVQQAKSGHPGAPMGMADIAEVLWNDFLQHNPSNPHWPNRDRFVLSNGHGSMLIYALLHLTGYQLTSDDLKNFRQLHSKTAGHPEYSLTPGVETTTGPLGQGIANAVGMAIAESILAAQFNRPEHNIINHYTYAFMGDGCMMEGISHEVCSLAGTLGLGKLIVFWDDNGISIDGKTAPWFAENTAARYRAYGWQVLADVDGHNSAEIRSAIISARAQTSQPTLICCRTTIGFGSPNLAGSEKCHGAPLGEQEITNTRKNLNWEYPPFVIPDSIYNAWNKIERGQQLEQEWQQSFTHYQQAYPELAHELQRRINGELPENWPQQAQQYIEQQQANPENIATRKASQNCLNQYAPLLPELLGGSADLTHSNLTLWSGCNPISQQQYNGNYIYYGVREFGMSAIMNGITLHGGFIPYGGTFLTFCDYARNAVRMAALMKIRCIFVYTHDSLALGEDGPTHQPVEHAAMLRLTPNMSVWRPCDSVESAVAWRTAIERQEGPSALLFSRQNLPHQVRDNATLQQIAKGAYILKNCAPLPDAILIATGSEVNLAMQAAEKLTAMGYHIRVVSMPCCDQFDKQESAYRTLVLPPHVTKRIAIEAASKDYWYKYVGLNGAIIGLDRFGESAPGDTVMAALGFNIENIITIALALINGE
jgi:transketolase